MLNSSMVVAWEGTDASGKTTLMMYVKELLISRGYRVSTYKTPSNTKTGMFAQEYGNSPNVDALTRMLLFAANTVDDSKLIRSQVDSLQPDFVFIDRYYLCSVVYGVAMLKILQNVDVGVDDLEDLLSIIEKLGSNILIKPDVYVIVDVEESVRIKRAIAKSSKQYIHDRSYELNSLLQNEIRSLYRVLVDRKRINAIWVENAENMLIENAESLSIRLEELRKELL